MTAVALTRTGSDPERDGGVAVDLLQLGHKYVLPDSTQVHLDRVTRHEGSGEVVQHLRVEDPYFARLRARLDPLSYRAECDSRDALQATFAHYETVLRSDPSDGTTSLAQEYMYDGYPAMNAWRDLFPTAKALYPLQYPESRKLPPHPKTKVEVAIDHDSYERFAYSLDAIAIRTRAVVARQIFTEHTLQSPKARLEWLSLGAGAAIPVFEGLQELQGMAPDKHVHATAVDMDPDALAFANRKRRDFGVRRKDVTFLQRHLIKDLVASDKLANEIGDQKPDMVDLLGVFEYFPDKAAGLLLRKSFDLVADDGILVFGNMLDTHPNLEINRRAVNWPDIKPRSLEQIKAIIEEAGISMDDVSIMIPEDGVYAVVRIEKRQKRVEKDVPIEHDRPLATVTHIGQVATLFTQHPGGLREAA